MISVITKRADFVRCSKAQRFGTKGIQRRSALAPRVFTYKAANVTRMKMGPASVSGSPVPKKSATPSRVGNAVARNRAKRRLREVARLILPDHGKDGWDYVLVGRHAATAAMPFAQLQSDLIRALAKVHG